jgi:phosphopantetheinyl transferase
MQRYLTAHEQATYERLSTAARTSWLLGRVAAKDAVRWWLADRGHVVAPDRVLVANEPGGRPVVRLDTGPGGTWPPPDLRISIAHVSGTGVAIVAEGQDVGIDVEETAPRPGSFARVAFSAGERAERAAATGASSATCSGPHATMDEATWMAAAWTAKEAVGKAAGTGLAGRPTRFVTSLVGPDLFAVGRALVRCTRLDPLRWCSAEGHPLVVGWTLSVDAPVEVEAVRPGSDAAARR